MIDKNNTLTMIIPIKADDFKYVEKLIPFAKKYINPKEIFVISSEKIKENCSYFNVKFINENEVIKDLNFNVLKFKFLELGLDTMAVGWFFQQFLKIGFANICKTEYYLTWDADTLPIRRIDLFDSNGKPYFTLKKEYLKRYFITLKRLLNINKTRKESFIAEHMVFKTDLVKEMIKEIELSKVLGHAFWEKILYATLPEGYNEPFAFSEFETYGNWIETKYPDVYAARKLNMLRNAKLYFGENPTKKEIEWAAKDFDALSFEHFDKQIISPKLLKIALNTISFKSFLRITYPFLNSAAKNKLRVFDWFFGNKTLYERSPEKDKNIDNILKTKILFDASVVNAFDDKSKNRTGLYWVSFNILKELSLYPNIELYLYSCDMKKTENFIKHYAKEIPNLNLFKGDILSVDVCLSCFNQISDEIKKTNIPCFTIIHDCIPIILPEYFEVCKGWFPNLLKSFTENDYCFSNSECTKRDFLRFCPRLDSEKITKIPLSTNQPYKPNKNLTMKIRSKYNIPADKKYLFSLCSLEPRKNLIRAVRTFIKFIEKNEIDDLVFVLGGGAYEGFIEKFEKELPEYQKYKDKIIRAGYVDDEDMEVLYSNAEWFVYTSRYEGFGMPPLEAMACGTAVITSNNSSLPEVVGDAGIMIDWDSDEQHIAAYEKYYFDKEYCKMMAQKGLERSKQFSWKNATDIMVKQFEKCKYKKCNILQTIIGQITINLFFINILKIKKSIAKTKVLLFGFLPLLKIKQKNNKIKISLFGLIPLYGKKQNGSKVKYKIFGIPILKSKQKNINLTAYYLFGIPFMYKKFK